MKIDELDNLITFKMGLPSLYHIMLGMSMDETDDYEKEIEDRQTDNYDLNDFLKKYNIEVERMGFSYKMRLTEMTISIPIEYITERDLKRLFDYFAYQMDVVELKFNYTSNANDDICELDILIRTDLYDVKIAKDDNNEYIIITFVSEDCTKLDKLRCLAIISDNEESLAKDIFDYVEAHDDYWDL